MQQAGGVHTYERTSCKHTKSHAWVSISRKIFQRLNRHFRYCLAQG